MLDQPPLWLNRGQVDVWIAFPDEAPASGSAAMCAAVLSEDECRRHARFVFEKDRRRYLVTRLLVRHALSRYEPIAPAEWRFVSNEYGRPAIAHPHPVAASLDFNLSHTDRVVLLAVTRGRRLGIDVEDERRKLPMALAERFFSTAEIAHLRALAPAPRSRCLLELWTLKESYIKARGRGLSLPLQRFGFDLDGERLGMSMDAGLDDVPGNWTFRQWRPAPGAIAALCLEHGGRAPMTVTVRHTIPFVRERALPFDAFRAS